MQAGHLEDERRRSESAEGRAPGEGARRRRRLRTTRTPRIGRYLVEMANETYLVHTVALLLVLWSLASWGMYAAERSMPGSSIQS
jgi:hypothetical protein